MHEKSIIKNAFYSFLKSFVTLLFPLITFPYASRILMPEGIGKINFSSSVLTYFGFIASLGIATYGIREASRIRNDKKALSKFTKEILSINAISTFISYVLFIIFLLIVPKFSNYRSLLLIYSIPLLLTMFSMDWFFNALEDFRYITLRSVLFQFLSLFILFFFVKTEDDCIWYAIMGIFGASCSSICNFIYSHKFVDYKIKIKLELKKHLKPILTFFGMSIVSSFYCVLDTTMLGFLSDDSQVGFYTSATKMNKMIITLITSLLAVLLPRLSNYIENNDMKKFNELTQKSFSITMLLSLPLATGLLLLAEPCILLLSGADYLPAIVPMKIMLPLFLIITTATLTGCQILPAINREKIALYSYIIGAVTNFTTNSILIPKYGCIGAAIGTITAESAVTIFQLIFTYKYLFSKKTLFVIFQAIISTLFMGIVVYIIRNLLDNYILQFIICTLSGVVTYFVVLLLLKNEFIYEFINTIKNKLSGKNETVSIPVIHNEKISILLATYNGEKYISEQLDSILNQTYQNFELFICDDCSTDNTFSIIKDYSSRSDKITIIKNEKNLGFKNTFEKLCTYATGNYIAFSDQDDIWYPNRLERCLSSINGYDIVCSDSLLIDEFGNSMKMTLFDTLRIPALLEYPELYFKHLFHANFVQGATVLIKTDFVKKYLPIPDVFVFHDWWFALNASLNNGILYLPECLIKYRQHHNQITCNVRVSFIKEFFNIKYPNISRHLQNGKNYCQYFLDNINLSEDNRQYLIETIDFFDNQLMKNRKAAFKYFLKNYYIITFDSSLLHKYLRLLKKRMGFIKNYIKIGIED